MAKALLPSSSVSPSLVSLFVNIRDVSLALGAAARAFVNRYEASRALSHFDDRMLADIGLTRNDVDAAFAEPLWRDPTCRLAVMAVERRAAARAARKVNEAPRRLRVVEHAAD